MVNATVRAVDGDVLVLTIGSEPLARRLSEQRNTDVIADALHAVLGVRWRVRCDHGDAAPPPARPAAIRSSAPPQRPSRLRRRRVLLPLVAPLLTTASRSRRSRRTRRPRRMTRRR